MRLVSIELFGFKSFPDKTKLSFDDGLTVVVGPNGSGKSNISDAIRWVLGETSSKSVRGSKMEDVIFGGADSRKPSSFAEVTITIDNSGDNRIPLDYDEISVTRRCHRGGDSEYIINGKTARLRDIQEIFMNTGLGKSGYSIIGQGRVAEILSQRSEERRGIFEEAAGISKYRFKKHEAENKLSNVSGDMVRIYDILHELQERVGPLEKEAEKARQYLEIYEEKKKLDISLWLLDMDNLRRRLDETELAYKEADVQLKRADIDLEALEKRSEELYGNAQENKLASEEIASKERDCGTERSETESRLAVAQNDLAHIAEQLSALEEDEKALRESLAALLGRRDDFAENLETLAAAEKSIEDEKFAAEAKESELRGIRSENELRQMNVSETIGSLEAMQVSARMQLSELTGSHSTDEERRAELERELEEYIASSDEAKTAIEKAEKTIASYQVNLEKINERISEEKEKSSALREEIEAVGASIASLSAERQGKSQRLDALRRMEEHFEGYNQSVRAVMSAAERGELKGVCGPVSRLISVKPKFTLAIETALGAALQNIVVEDEASAKSAIAYLKNKNAGRATFCPITSVRGESGRNNNLTSAAGFFGMADTLCDADAKYSGVISFLLGRCAVFDNLDNAGNAAKASGYRIRAVTLDGQLINAGGTFTGGSAKRDSGVLTRNADIEKLRAEIKALELKIDADKAENEKLRAQAQKDAGAITGSETERTLVERLIGAEQTQLSVLISRRETDERQIAAVKDELDKLGRHAMQDKLEAEGIEKDIAAREAAISEAKDTLASLEESEKKLTEEIVKLSGTISSLLVKLASAKKDTEAAILAHDTTQSDIESASERLDKMTMRRSELSERKNERDEIVSLCRSRLDELASVAEELSVQREKLLKEGEHNDEQLSIIRNKTKELTRDRETLFRAYTKLSSERDSMLSEQDKLAARIWDDYELTYSAAVELGIVPLAQADRPSAASRQATLKSKIKSLGSVNINAIEEYADVKQRCDFMTTQYDDLAKSRDELSKIIIKLEEEMRVRFSTVMKELSEQFQLVFSELFGGGTAELKLTDPEDVLQSGIEINVAPPGKIIKSLALLSGGEQAFVAIAIFFAILRVNPTPFAVLDEIEAALDEINVARFATYMKRFSDRTQFIAITHRRGTMENADTIYGITMPQRGISRVLPMHVNEIEDKLNLEN